MPVRSPKPSPSAWISALVAITLFAPGAHLIAQSGPSPYRTVDGWAKLPDGRQMGAVGKVTTDPDGEHIWAVIRCDAGGDRFGNECMDSALDPVVKFDLDGNVVASFGGGMFIWPHGIDVDSNGNVWVTDAVSSANIPDGDSRGHQVIKFSPSGEVLFRLGTPGVAGSGPRSFNSPSDVVVAPNGTVFIADGHNNDGNNRVVTYTSDGEYVRAWGRTGYGPQEFRALHAIDMDSNGADLRGRSQQQPDPDLRGGRHTLGHLDPVRPSERDRLRWERPDLRGRLGVGQRAESRLGNGDPHRRRRDRLGNRLHHLPVGRPA